MPGKKGNNSFSAEKMYAGELSKDFHEELSQLREKEQLVVS